MAHVVLIRASHARIEANRGIIPFEAGNETKCSSGLCVCSVILERRMQRAR